MEPAGNLRIDEGQRIAADDIFRDAAEEPPRPDEDERTDCEMQPEVADGRQARFEKCDLRRKAAAYRDDARVFDEALPTSVDRVSPQSSSWRLQSMMRRPWYCIGKEELPLSDPRHPHDHDHDRDHDHDHGHGHDHGAGAHVHGLPANMGRAFAIGIALNLGFVVLEIAYGIYANSLALLSDAGHNFSDVVSLLFAWAAATLAKRLPSPRFTYGLRGTTILATLGNAMLLLVAMGGIIWESIQRLSEPAPVQGWVVIWVALAGVVINTATAVLFMRGREDDLNIRGAYLHMASDAMVSVGVALAGVVCNVASTTARTRCSEICGRRPGRSTRPTGTPRRN